MLWVAETNLATEFDLHSRFGKFSSGGSNSREIHCQQCIASQRLTVKTRNK